jgi:hypothetical protein
MNTDILNLLREGSAVTIDDVSLQQPACWDRSDNGALIVLDEGSVQDVQCTAYLFDEQTSFVHERTFAGAAAACAVHPDGRFAVVATLKPDDRLYALNMDTGSEIWARQNYETFACRSKRPQITNVTIDRNGLTTVYTTGVEAYHLTKEGKLTEADRQERDRFQQLDDEDPSGVSVTESYLDDPDLGKNVKAVLELEIRADEPFVRKHLPDFAPMIIGSIERHGVHELDLTDPSVAEAQRKLMSAGKRLVYEACRERPSLLESVLPVLRTHFEHQPEAAIHSDYQQLKQLAPSSLDLTDISDLTSDASCSSPQRSSGSQSAKQQSTNPEKSDRGGCCVFSFALCMTVLLLMVLVGFRL